MNRSLAPHLYHIVGVCARIVMTRESPEALPYSRALFQGALGGALLFGILNRILIPDVTVGHAVLNSAGEVMLLLVGLHVVLSAKGMSDRFQKVATAMLCISTLGGALLLTLGRLPDSAAVQFLITGTYIAQLSGALTCLRRGLAISWWSAGLYLFAYLWITMLFFSISNALIHSGGGVGHSDPRGQV